MSIEIEFMGLDDILKNLEGLAFGSELDQVATKIIEEEAEKAKSEIASNFPKSKDNSKSGKRGNRPRGHFADNVPKSKVKKKNDFINITLGDEKENGEYFYTNYKEFGTSKMMPALIFAKVRETIKVELNEKGIKEYGKLLQEKLGG